MRSATWVVSSVFVLAMACGGNNGGSNNGASNNGASNNGASNNGASNNGASNNGASNNGTTATTNNGTTNVSNNGTTTGGTFFRFDLDGTAVELNPGASFIAPQSYGLSGADVNFMYSMSFGVITTGPGSFECGSGVTNFTFVDSGTAYTRGNDGSCAVELTTATGSGGRVEGTFEATLYDDGGNMVTISNGEFAADVP